MKKIALVVAGAALLATNFACGATFNVSIQNFQFTPKIQNTSDRTDMVVWKNNDTFDHTSTSDQGFWDSGHITPTSMYTNSALDYTGNFNYHCAIHKEMKGTVRVPLGTSSVGSEAVGNSITLFWAGNAGSPTAILAGQNMDVQALIPGKQGYKTIFKDQTGSQDSGSYTLSKKGTYKFRARLQFDTGKASAYSLPESITVS